MAEMKEVAAPEKRSYKKMHHMEIEQVKGEHGGHMVTHHYHQDGMEMRKPEVHMFPKGAGEEMMAHIAKHAGVKMAGPENEEENASMPAEEEVEA